MVNEEEEKLITACTYEEQEATEPIPNKGNISLDLAIPNNAEEWLKETIQKTVPDINYCPQPHTNLTK